ncbi:MAG: ABC transporter permease [Bacteroidota bacterium]
MMAAMRFNKVKTQSYYADVFQNFKRHKLAMVSLCAIIVIGLVVVILPPILHLDPYMASQGKAYALPSVVFPLGLDALGRDNLARLLYGGRTSMLVGLLSTMISILIGVPLGLCAGYFRGWSESLVMRLVDIFMCFPSIILILVLVSVIGPSVWSVTLIIGVIGWPQFARIVHGSVLSICAKEYVEGAQAIGGSHFRILKDYILPNSISPVLVTITYRTAGAILQEASLSYLGMGVQPPAASLGNILNSAQSITTLATRPWYWMPPALMLVLIVLSINFIGDGVRDALDPKMEA